IENAAVARQRKTRGELLDQIRALYKAAGEDYGEDLDITAFLSASDLQYGKLPYRFEFPDGSKANKGQFALGLFEDIKNLKLAVRVRNGEFQIRFTGTTTREEETVTRSSYFRVTPAGVLPILSDEAVLGEQAKIEAERQLRALYAEALASEGQIFRKK